MLLNCGVGEDSESPLNCKKIKPVHPKRDQSWVFIGRTDVEAETPILWPPDAKSWLIWKDPDAGKDWRWEEKGTTEDEMVGWHHWLDGHEFEWTLGSWWWTGREAWCAAVHGVAELDRTEWLNWRTWKQLRCLSTDEGIKKLWYLYTMKYYSAIKRNTFESNLMRWISLGFSIQNEVRKRKTNIIY